MQPQHSPEPFPSGGGVQTEGELDEAAAACIEALRLLDSAGQSDSPDAANLLNDLAEIESERQNASAAFSWARRAQDIENRLADQFCGVLATRIRARTLKLMAKLGARAENTTPPKPA